VLLDLFHAPDDLPSWLGSYAEPLERRRLLELATANAEECLVISQELSKPDTLFESQVLLARLDAAKGNATAAHAKLMAMLKEAADDGQRAALHYWLWKLNATDADHRAEALRLYQSLWEKTPKHNYRKRIDELHAAEKSP
jgi:hypothetical protein